MSTDDRAVSTPYVPSDITALTQSLAAREKASKAREQQMAVMFQQTMQTLQQQSGSVGVMTSNSSGAANAQTAPAPKPASAVRPLLLYRPPHWLTIRPVWRPGNNYPRYQHLASQSLSTAFRQSLDEDLRRFIREVAIHMPDSADVADAVDFLRAHIRRQCNSLLDRIDFHCLA